MALTELSALETAYHSLEPLDDAGRRRALQWLSDALGETQPLAAASTASASNGTATAPAPAAPQPTRRRRRTTSTSAAPAASKATSGGRGRKRKGQNKSTASTGGERAYRRMPDPDEVLNAYQQVGTVSGLADHFDVPKHTVHNWARRLRSQGYNIGRNS